MDNISDLIIRFQIMYMDFSVFLWCDIDLNQIYLHTTPFSQKKKKSDLAKLLIHLSIKYIVILKEKKKQKI